MSRLVNLTSNLDAEARHKSDGEGYAQLRKGSMPYPGAGSLADGQGHEPVEVQRIMERSN